MQQKKMPSPGPEGMASRNSAGLDRVIENQLGRGGPECPGGHKATHEQTILSSCKGYQ